MIPHFPSFKCLTWNDRREIEQFTNGFLPYSDFNFTSLYVWNIENKMQVAQLNGNLVVQFCDYLTGNSFLSFIGKNEINATASTLIEYSKEYFNEPLLRLIPDVVVQGLCSNSFAITPDRDSFDYIYSTSDFRELHTWPCKYRVAG